MKSSELVLVDLSSIAYPIWHTSQAEPDPNRTSQQIVARVRALASSHPHAAICCDLGKSFRHDLAASYKANRPEREAALHHQIDLAKEQLAADGFPVWAVRGFEADDLIATGVRRALDMDEVTVLIVSADKDLLQLVGPRVKAHSPATGATLDEEAVFAKFGIPPAKMVDYLTLVGDASDNVKGATGIGPKKAAELLGRFGSIDAAYAALEDGQTANGFTPSLAGSLREFKSSLPTTRALITLRTDADIPFEEITAERVAKEAETFGMDIEEEDDMENETMPSADAPATATEPADAPAFQAQTALAVRDAEVVAPAEYERQLDPRSMKDAQVLAKHFFESRMFSAYGTPQAVLSTIMLGRELGLPAMASLRGVHVIEGRHALSASLMVALVLKSGFAEYFEPIAFDDKAATFETKRKGARNPVTLTHTIEMAQQAGLVKDKSGWQKNPVDMLVARATARLARMVYPDLLAGLYTPEEIADINDEKRTAA